jgi:hypothetical protein
MGKRLMSAISGATNPLGFQPAAWQTAVMSTATLATRLLWDSRLQESFTASLERQLVFAFVMVGIFLMTAMTRMISSYEKLAVEQVSLFNPILDQVKDGRNRKLLESKKSYIRVTLRNHSQQTLYFKTRRATHSMAGKRWLDSISFLSI